MDSFSHELTSEQRHLEHARTCLDAMRARTAEAVADAEAVVRMGGGADADVILQHLEVRLAALAETRASLCFGRVDYEGDERLYIGRRHVEDGKGDPVVVDWRAPASTPFYRATWADPMGLLLRRRFVVEDRRLVDLFDEDFTDGAAQGGGGLPDPLLAELERARTGEMRDIVATIQAEQDVVIRAPLAETVIVQGGPGTGKTAVGLHRAAFLLYEHRELLEKRRVLVVGPNPVFLRYIASVLPSLGETSVVQATVESLMAGRYPVAAEEPADVAAAKGQPGMADVLRRAVRSRVAVPTGVVEVMGPRGIGRMEAAEVAQVVDVVKALALPHNVARNVLREHLLTALGGDDVRAITGFRAVLDSVWPSLTAAGVVRAVLADPAAFGADVLLRRRGRSRWTRADLALLDEAEALTAGVTSTYGHVVVDEAQDLSAMELRLVARRSPDRSMTVLGDLAQATSVAGQRRWDEAVVHLGAPRARVAELALGYRVPAPILDFANRLLPVAAPDVRPSRSVRTGGDPPHIVRVDSLGHGVAAQTVALAGRWTSVGVIVPTMALDAVAAALAAAGVAFADGRRGALSDAVTLLGPAAAKGLEFDAVLVAEPARIVAEEPSGHRALYVALTRAVQEVVIVSTADLPDLLAPLPV
jgi:DNA helicase IV